MIVSFFVILSHTSSASISLPSRFILLLLNTISVYCECGSCIPELLENAYEISKFFGGQDLDQVFSSSPPPHPFFLSEIPFV